MRGRARVGARSSEYRWRSGGATLAALLAGLVVIAPVASSPASGRTTAELPEGRSEPQPGDRYVPGELLVRFQGERQERVVELPRGLGVREAARRLERESDVRYAVPNHVAHAAGIVPFIPTDPGTSGLLAGWRADQWNFTGTSGVSVRAIGAWNNLIEAGRPGGARTGSGEGLPEDYGIKVAVVDTGVAYRSLGCGDGACDFRRNPDFVADQFVRGKDFVDDDRTPLDENGHGTHVAATIGEQVTNAPFPAPEAAVTGLAYGARIMPVRVLNASGLGGAGNVARGIRWAAKHRAKVINLSVEFEQRGKQAVDGCADIPGVCKAINFATERGALVVAAAGNVAGGPATPVAYPARKRNVLAVGATTEHRCLASYSQYGKGLDLVAPGGGANAGASVLGDGACTPKQDGRLIVQYGLASAHAGDYTTFDFDRMRGTSMAAAHASAAAALVRASGVLGSPVKPADLARRLKRTARDIPPRGADSRYGKGLLDADRATEP